MFDDDDDETRKIVSTIKDGAIIIRRGCKPVYIYPTSENLKESDDVVLMLEFFRWCQDNKDVVEDFIREYMIYQKDIEVQHEQKKRDLQKSKLTIVTDKKDLDKE